MNEVRILTKEVNNESLALSTDLINRSEFSTSLEVKSSALSYVHKRVINSQKRRSKTSSEIAESRLRTKNHLVTLARELKEHELANKLINCHSRVALLSCGQHISRIIPNHTCEFRLCPNCARRRARRHFNNYLPKVLGFIRGRCVTPVHLVLTQKHRKETLEVSVNRLMSAFRNLVRRQFWKSHFRGGTWSVEVTKGKDGLYHTHLHLLAFRSRFFDIELLRSEWLSVTGDSVNLNLKPILEDVSSGLREVLKYIAKPLDIKKFTVNNLRDFLQIKNTRFFGTFGGFREFCASFEPSDNADLSTNLLSDGFRDLVEGCACPYCNMPLLEVRLYENELPIFLRKVEIAKRSKSPPI